MVSIFHLHLKKKKKKKRKKKPPPWLYEWKDYYYYLRYILDIDRYMVYVVPTGYVKKWVGFGNNYIHTW